MNFRFEKAGNLELAMNLADWVFKSRGVLRVGQVKHHIQGEKEPPQAYTIFDMVVCTGIAISPSSVSMHSKNDL